MNFGRLQAKTPQPFHKKAQAGQTRPARALWREKKEAYTRALRRARAKSAALWPAPVEGRRQAVRFLQNLHAEQAQQHAGRHRAADHAGHVGPHGVHQQKVCGVRPLPLLLAHPGRHGNGGNARGADQGIDLFL